MDGAAFLGREIRLTRERAGLSQRQLAEKIHYGQPFVSKVEQGQQLATVRLVEQADELFVTHGYLGRLREQVAQNIHPSWFVEYVELERAAKGVLDYSNAFVTGLLQTEEYATAVFRVAVPRLAPDEIREKVAARMARAEVLDKPNGPTLWVILHEATLRSEVGGPTVMRNQLRSLLEASEQPKITIQVLPFRAGASPCHVPFIILDQGEGSHVLYSETPLRGLVDPDPANAAHAVAVFERLRAAALSEDDSRSLMRTTMKEYDRC